MTLDDLERENKGFYGFWGDFWLQDTFQERIALKPIEINMEKLRIKFLALNVDSDGFSLDFLGSRKPAHEGIKERYPRKSCYFTVVNQSFVKTVADRHWACYLSQQKLMTSFSVVSTSMTLKKSKLLKKRFLLIFAIFGCSTHSKNKL